MIKVHADREDLSGNIIVKRLEKEGYEVVEKIILPDEKSLLRKELIRLSDQRQLDLILTTGEQDWDYVILHLK